MYVVAKTQLHTDLGFLVILGIMVACYPLYFLTVGKNDYWRLTEKDEKPDFTETYRTNENQIY